MPTTVNCFSRGTTPAGVTCPCGVISTSFSPVSTPRDRASSAPSTMPNSPARSASSRPVRMCEPISATLSSIPGITPRTTDPRTFWPKERSPWALTKGAVPITRGCSAALFATAGQSASRLLTPEIWTCEATPRMRVRSSFWNPFITESTTISAATPSAMPAMDISEMKEMKWLRRFARV